MSMTTKKRCSEELFQELSLDEGKWKKEDEDIARQKLEIFDEISVQKLISTVYKKNEGIAKIALFGLLQICREKSDKDKLIEIVVHHILNAAQNGLGCKKSCDFLRASLWTVGAIPMNKSFALRVVEITSKKALAVTNSEESKIISEFATDLSSKMSQPR